MNYFSLSCKCGHWLAPIIYGIPTTHMIDLAISNTIALGGPKVKDETHYCYSCGNTVIVEL